MDLVRRILSSIAKDWLFGRVCGVPLEAMYANLYAQEERKEVGEKE
jgi:hypothetical protein